MPNVEILNISKNKISDEEGMNQSIITVRFDSNTIRHIARLDGVDHETGVLIYDYNGFKNKDENIEIIINWDKLLYEGDNKINIYAQSEDGSWDINSEPLIIKSIYGNTFYGYRTYGKR